MSKNFFAALDDSGDEGAPAKKAPPLPKKEQKKVTVPDQAGKQDREHRRNPNNDRNTKSGRGRPPARDGKRTYDRRSGTGRGKEIKKGGGGARNWGSDKNDAKRAEGAVIEGDEAAALEPTPEAGEGEENKTPEEEVKAEEADEEEEEEEDKTMTYEEYLKAKEEEKKKSDAFKPLATKELDNSEFSGKTAKVAKEEDFLVMGGGKQPRKKGNKGKEKERVVAGFRVSDSSAGSDRDRKDRPRRDDRGGRGDRRGGRSGRGGREGGGGRGRGRGDRQRKPASLNVTDPNAFPSL